MNYKLLAESVASGERPVNDNDTKMIVAAILSLGENGATDVQAARERKKLEIRTWALRASLAFNVAIVTSTLLRFVS